MKLRILEGVLLAALAGGLLAGPVAAADRAAGDLIVRAGAAGVYPNVDSDMVPGIPGSEVDVDNAWSLGLTGTWMATDRIGVGLMVAWPFEHDIEGDGTISGLGDVAETKALPPTLTLQYHFPTGSRFHPYVGAGVNYTHFFDEDTKGALSGLNIDLDNSWGLAGEVGIDVDLNEDWVVSGQVWYMDIDTEADISGISTFDVEIDPWVFMVGIGRKF